ncbi:acyl-CoA dehydrogenase [Sphingomonas sp. UYEF23]|uniref:acyl-CoA dehydrogenase n=1 Tax=Sphingomonas sp. UYEF23 TaxID=1756408 RepID=UPI003396FA4E
MTSLAPLRATLDFLVNDWLTVDEDRATVDGLLDLAQAIATDHFLPHYKLTDGQEPRLDADGVHAHPAIAPALRQYAEAGLFAAGFAPELGGMGLAAVLTSATFALFAAANIATAAYPMLTTANARLIATFGTPEQIDAFARPQIAGSWFGTMCLSEPQAGSSLGDIRTRAVADGVDDLGGRYRLTGNKMWISGGDQDVSENIVHLVLAKVPNADGTLPEGTAGISLFIVPKNLADGSRNDVVVAGLNHKMGYRGIPNCLLNLGEQGGATGWRVGEPGQGLKQMFLMMNEARIGVATGAAALAMRGYALSLDYARDRTQGRTAGTRGGAPVPIIAHADVRHMLLQQKVYAEGALALCLYCAALVDQSEEALLGLLTPVAKTWSSEFGLAANDLAIQVHGGYGYTRDFDVEQLWRDNRLNPIHEGTTGIQAIDLIGRKLQGKDGAYAALRARIADSTGRAQAGTLADVAEAVTAAWARIDTTRDRLSDHQQAAYDNATAFLRAFGHATVGWLWLDMALAAEGEDARSHGRRHAARYFASIELPRVAAWLAPVDALDRLAAEMPADGF